MCDFLWFDSTSPPILKTTTTKTKQNSNDQIQTKGILNKIGQVHYARMPSSFQVARSIRVSMMALAICQTARCCAFVDKDSEAPGVPKTSTIVFHLLVSTVVSVSTESIISPAVVPTLGKIESSFFSPIFRSISTDLCSFTFWLVGLNRFQGERCQRKINQCLSEPCQHGGTCFDRFGSYVCQCGGGFSGANCEREMSSRVTLI